MPTYLFILSVSGAESWRTEFKRLTDNVPMVMTDVLTNHSHQVLHVSFSHNGKMFATCSKDGFIIVSIFLHSNRYALAYRVLCMSFRKAKVDNFHGRLQII